MFSGEHDILLPARLVRPWSTRVALYAVALTHGTADAFQRVTTNALQRALGENSTPFSGEEAQRAAATPQRTATVAQSV